MSIAVTGASGGLGGLVVRALLDRGVRPVGIVRNPAKAADLAELGVDVRQADYGDAAALDRALDGVRKLLLVSGSEVGSRTPQHVNVIRAAERAGVELLAYTSIPRAKESPLALAREHKETEDVLAESSVASVLLRNNWYWENYLGDLEHAVASGVFARAAGAGLAAPAAKNDYALAAAEVLTADGHAGRVYELGGDQPITYAQLAQAISEASGKPVRYESLSESDYLAALLGAGLPEAMARTLADADACVAEGWLDVRTDDLHRLIGGPTTGAVDFFRAALPH